MPTDTSVPLNGAAPRPLTVAYVPGVTPGKWITRWEERRLAELRSYQCEEDAVLAELSSGRADLGFLRFPAEGYVRPGGLNLIPLYEEQPVAVAAKEHPLAAFEELEGRRKFMVEIPKGSSVDGALKLALDCIRLQ